MAQDDDSVRLFSASGEASSVPQCLRRASSVPQASGEASMRCREAIMQRLNTDLHIHCRTHSRLHLASAPRTTQCLEAVMQLCGTGFSSEKI